MVDDILRSTRVFVVQKNGELSDKFGRNINLICEYDPQGMNLKMFSGKIFANEFLFVYPYI